MPAPIESIPAEIAAQIDAERIRHEAVLIDGLIAYWRAQDAAEVREYTRGWIGHGGRAEQPQSGGTGSLNDFYECWRAFARYMFASTASALLDGPERGRTIDGAISRAALIVAETIFGVSDSRVGAALESLGEVSREVGGYRIKQPKGEAFVSLSDAPSLMGMEGAFDRLLKQTLGASFQQETAFALYEGYRLYRSDVAGGIDQVMKLERARWRARPAHQPLTTPLEVKVPAPFPNRAAWLAEQLKARSWSKHRFNEFGGPDRKTTQAVLNGKAVREGTIDSIVTGLNAHNRLTGVSIADVPVD